MIIEAVISIIFVLSFGGVLLILIRKLPVLNTLPQNEISEEKKHRIILSIENKAKGILISFEKQIFLHKFLSWVKVMTLKAETNIDKRLHKIRKKAQEIDKEISDKK